MPNLYPALEQTGASQPAAPPGELFACSAATGAHEVIINGPQPVLSLAELPSEQVLCAVDTWRERMRAHGDAVLGFCIRVLRDRDLAEEMRQQTFLEAFRDFDRFQERSSRRAWLFGIASHRCLDALRKRRPGWIASDHDALMKRRRP